MLNSGQSNARRYRFDDVTVDCGNFNVQKCGQVQALTPRAFDVLLYLMDHQGRVVEKQELFERVWKEQFVTDNALTQVIKEIRQAIGDDASMPRYVETVHRRGYRFIYPVEEPEPRARRPRWVVALGLGVPRAPRVGVEARRRLAWRVRALRAVLLVAVVGIAGYFAQQRFWPQANPPAGKIMLAVLPFDNLSADPEQEYFSDGMTEEMISQLGSLHPQRLGVIARTSAMKYKGTDKGIDEIGRELSVDYILEGSVRREAERVRITAQLIQVSDQTQVWTESYERELAGVFVIQNEVAGRIARSLEMELLPAQRSALVRTPTTSSEAHVAYLKGRYYWDKRTGEGIKKSLDYFQEAIARDPDYALAHSGMADAYRTGVAYGYLPSDENLSRARAAALRAVELDDTLAEAHVSLSGNFLEKLDWLGEEREYKRAIELNPNYATAHRWYSIHLAARGRHEQALVEAKKALELDPVSLPINVSVGVRFYYLRRYDQAIEQFNKTIELDPNYFHTYFWLGQVYGQNKMYDEAIAAHQKAFALSNRPYEVAGLGFAYGAAGRRDEALNILEELEQLSKQKYVFPMSFAFVYIGLGEREQALDWLEKSFEENPGRLASISVDPWFDPLRSDPRFHSLPPPHELPVVGSSLQFSLTPSNWQE